MQRLVCHMQAKPPVAFELRFREELLSSRLLWKLAVFAAILLYICRFVSGDAGLEVQQPARRAVRFRVMNSSYHAMRAVETVAGPDRTRVNFNLHPEVGPALPHGAAQRSKVVIAVRFSVNLDHVVATPAHQFVEPEVLAITTVREIQVAR